MKYILAVVFMVILVVDVSAEAVRYNDNGKLYVGRDGIPGGTISFLNLTTSIPSENIVAIPDGDIQEAACRLLPGCDGPDLPINLEWSTLQATYNMDTREVSSNATLAQMMGHVFIIGLRGVDSNNGKHWDGATIHYNENGQVCKQPKKNIPVVKGGDLIYLNYGGIREILESPHYNELITICDPDANTGFAVIYINVNPERVGDSNELPARARNVAVIAHELGRVLGLSHAENCIATVPELMYTAAHLDNKCGVTQVFSDGEVTLLENMYQDWSNITPNE